MNILQIKQHFIPIMSRDRVRTKVDKTGEVKAFSQTSISNNQAVVEYCRTSMAALSGGAAGILGLSTLYGFAFYAVSVVVLWLMILWKAGGSWKKYFGSRQALLTNGFFGQMFTYVLFWTVWNGPRVLDRDGPCVLDRDGIFIFDFLFSDH